MKNSRRNTEDTDRNTDKTEETQRKITKKNFNLKMGYCFLEFSYKHNIHNSCDLPNSCFNYLVNHQTLNNARRTFFKRWLVIAIFELFSVVCVKMYCFASTGAAQKISTAILPVLSKTLKKSTFTMGLALILYQNIKQFTNLWHFWESIYECAESVIRKCSKEKVHSSFFTAPETELGYYHHRSELLHKFPHHLSLKFSGN